MHLRGDALLRQVLKILLPLLVSHQLLKLVGLRCGMESLQLNVVILHRLELSLESQVLLSLGIRATEVKKLGMLLLVIL
jgi:hypothetical protein